MLVIAIIKLCLADFPGVFHRLNMYLSSGVCLNAFNAFFCHYGFDELSDTQ